MWLFLTAALLAHRLLHFIGLLLIDVENKSEKNLHEQPDLVELRLKHYRYIYCLADFLVETAENGPKSKWGPVRRLFAQLALAEGACTARRRRRRRTRSATSSLRRRASGPDFGPRKRSFLPPTAAARCRVICKWLSSLGYREWIM